MSYSKSYITEHYYLRPCYKTYFDKPTQVLFYDRDIRIEPVEVDSMRYYQAGIAYKTNLICARCGNVIEICESVAKATLDNVAPFYEYEWLDLTEEIVGNETVYKALRETC